MHLNTLIPISWLRLFKIANKHKAQHIYSFQQSTHQQAYTDTYSSQINYQNK